MKYCRNWWVIWFWFFITKPFSKTMPSWHYFACSCILVGREVNTIATRVSLPVNKKREGLRKAKAQQPLDEKRTHSSLLAKMQLHSKWHHEGTVWLQHLVIKKQNHNTLVTLLNLTLVFSMENFWKITYGLT